MEMLIPILFWMSVPLSIFLSVFGVLKNKYWLVLIGAVLFFPISYYFNGSPTFHGYGLFLPIFQIISAAAVKEEKKIMGMAVLIARGLRRLLVHICGVVISIRLSSDIRYD